MTDPSLKIYSGSYDVISEGDFDMQRIEVNEQKVIGLRGASVTNAVAGAATNAVTNLATNYNLVSGLLGIANGLNDANSAQNDLATKYNALATKSNNIAGTLNTLMDRLRPTGHGLIAS